MSMVVKLAPQTSEKTAQMEPRTQHPEKTSLDDSPKTPRRALNWQKVLGVIGDSKALPVLLTRLQVLQNKGCQGSPKPVPAASLGRGVPNWKPGVPLVAVRDFMVSREARVTVCCALTYVEDWLDYEYPKDPVRVKIASLRRQLEKELETT